MKTIKEAAKDWVWESGNTHPQDAFVAGVEFAQQWISVEKELPESGKTVLIKDKNGMIGLACIRFGDWDYKFKKMIEYWRPITKV